MIPKNKTISILHPYVNKRWWAVNMMIYLSKTLIKKGNNVIFYTFSYDKDLFPEIDFEVKCLNLFKTSYAIRNSDYIIIWNSPMQFAWVLSKVMFLWSAKLIWWHHHYPWYYSENTDVFILLKRFLEKLSIKKIDLLLSNSQYLSNALKDIYKKESKILNPVLDDIFLSQNSTLTNKIKTSPLTKIVSETSPLTPLLKGEGKEDEKVIFSYGRWVSWKNVKQIFDTYEFVKKEVPSTKLLIWWVGEELTYFQNKFKLDKDVTFLWLLDKNSIIENLKKSSVFLFPSTIDSFWMTIIEAMSIWVPVVAFDLNASSEIINHWQNWFLVKSKSDFSKKVLKIISDDELQLYLSNNCLSITNRYWNINFDNQLSTIFLP